MCSFCGVSEENCIYLFWGCPCASNFRRDHTELLTRHHRVTGPKVMNKLRFFFHPIYILLDHCPLIARYHTDNSLIKILHYQYVLAKLQYYGIRGIANVWFESRNNRKQFVRGTSSDFQTVTFDVPQGSVLGLLLFLFA